MNEYKYFGLRRCVLLRIYIRHQYTAIPCVTRVVRGKGHDVFGKTAWERLLIGEDENAHGPVRQPFKIHIIR